MNFRPFGPDHWGVLILTFAVGLGLVIAARKIRSVRQDSFIRYPFSLALLLNESVAWIYYKSVGITIIPLQLCELTVLLMAWALLAKGRRVAALAFFWGLAGSSQAILTPDLWEPFPSFVWFSFFLSHCGVVLSAIFLSVRGLVKTTIGSVWRVWAVTNLYVAAVGIVNWRIGTNFGYLAAKPDHPSLLDYLGPWPYYIFWCELIALGLFFLCHAFNQMINRRL